MQSRKHSESLGPARFRNVSGILPAFVALSVLVHGSIILFSSTEEQPIFVPRMGTTIISTLIRPSNNVPTLQPPRSVTPKEIKNISKKEQLISSRKADTTAVKPKPTLAHSQQKNAVPQESVPPKTTKTITTALNTATAAKSSTSVQQQRNYLLGELQNRLSQYLVYPMRARRRGWQGEVLVAFRINELGQLGSVRLERSSGYSLLDHSALNAMSQLKSIDLPETLGPAQAMNLQLPVHYRLQEG